MSILEGTLKNLMMVGHVPILLVISIMERVIHLNKVMLLDEWEKVQDMEKTLGKREEEEDYILLEKKLSLKEKAEAILDTIVNITSYYNCSIYNYNSFVLLSLYQYRPLVDHCIFV